MPTAALMRRRYALPGAAESATRNSEPASFVVIRVAREEPLLASGRAREVLSKEEHVKGMHPDLVMTHVRCNTCGTEFTTRSTRAELTLDVCSNCHPAYTGVEREVVRGSRVERFERRRARAATA